MATDIIMMYLSICIYCDHNSVKDTINLVLIKKVTNINVVKMTKSFISLLQ